MKIAPKAVLLFVLLGVAPVATTLGVFLPRYEDAVRAGEQRATLIAAGEINRLVGAHVESVLADARTMAGATARAAEAGPEGEAAASAALEMVLSTRGTIDVARIEVPSRSLDLLLAKRDADTSLAPRSTAALREEADRNGSAFALEGPRRGVLVVPIPRGAGEAQKPSGYVTVPVYLQGLALDLQSLAEARGLDQSQRSSIVLVDADKRVVAAVGKTSLEVGDDAKSARLFAHVPSDARSARVDLQEDTAADDGAPSSLTLVSVGRYDQSQYLGWLVAIEQPHEVVYARLYQTQRLFFAVGAAALLAGLVAALFAARAVTKPVHALHAQAERIGRRRYRELSPQLGRSDELGELDRALLRMAADLEAQEKEIAREAEHRANLARFMSPELVEAIVRGEHSLELGGHRAEITVLFADVVAFTPLAERRDPELAVAILNELFSLLTEVVFRHGGLVDKFVGDSVMAVWGAPVPQADHAQRAVAAAEDMLRFIEPAAELWREKYDVVVRLAVGVNSGAAVVGNIGSTKRMEYTAIGDVVNVAARLEGLAEPGQILMGPRTAELVGDSFELEDLGPTKLAGRREELRVFALEG